MVIGGTKRISINNAARIASIAATGASRNSRTASVDVNNAAAQIENLRGISQSNSAFNAAEAEKQRDWSAEQSANAMRFNAAEAAKTRDWTEIMSNTAHQREINDLMAAGLNPVLSAMNGNGAAVTSGATASGVVGSGSKADADTSMSGAIANLLGSIIAAQTQIQNANINARTQEAVADKYNAMSKIVAEINAAAGIREAGIHAGASRYASEQGAAASRYATDHTKTGLLSEALVGVIDGLTDNEGSGYSIGDYTRKGVSKIKGLFSKNAFSGKVAGRRGDN